MIVSIEKSTCFIRFKNVEAIYENHDVVNLTLEDGTNVPLKKDNIKELKII